MISMVHEQTTTLHTDAKNAIYSSDDFLPGEDMKTLSVAETLAALGLAPTSRGTLYKLIEDGKLHPLRRKIFGTGKGGQRVSFDADEVEALRTANEGDEAPATKPRAKRKK